MYEPNKIGKADAIVRPAAAQILKHLIRDLACDLAAETYLFAHAFQLLLVQVVVGGVTEVRPDVVQTVRQVLKVDVACICELMRGWPMGVVCRIGVRALGVGVE